MGQAQAPLRAGRDRPEQRTTLRVLATLYRPDRTVTFPSRRFASHLFHQSAQLNSAPDPHHQSAGFSQYGAASDFGFRPTSPRNNSSPVRNSHRLRPALGRYTHKSAIANHRLVEFNGEHVRFRWRDYPRGNKVKVMCLDAGEFIRFLLHVLPRGFARLRHYGLLANRGRARKLALCRGALLAQPVP